MSHNQIGTVNGDGTFNPYGSTVGDTVSANNVTYDNTSSGLTATDVQDALTELNNTLNGTPKIYTLTLSGITVTANSPYTVDNVSSQIGIDKGRIKGAFIGYAGGSTFDKNVSSVTWGGYYDFLAFTPSVSGDYTITLNIVYI